MSIYRCHASLNSSATRDRHELHGQQNRKVKVNDRRDQQRKKKNYMHDLEKY